jgi:hypothetical protein
MKKSEVHPIMSKHILVETNYPTLVPTNLDLPIPS